MRHYTTLLREAGWEMSFAPMYLLGLNISWLVMKEVFISPYDRQAYSFSDAMQQEKQQHPYFASTANLA